MYPRVSLGHEEAFTIPFLDMGVTQENWDPYYFFIRVI